MSELLSLEEAQQRLLALAPVMRETMVEALLANGHYLARDLVANRTQPPASLSAMDGYAIYGDGPWERVGESRAGTPFERTLEPGECARISTGAHMPSGADRVLIQENAQIEGGTVALKDGEVLPLPLRHVRPMGFDFKEGETVLKRGTKLGPAQLALAVSAGHGHLQVRERPSIAILDSGDELVAATEPCGPHQIPASNGPMIGAMVAPMVDAVQFLGPVPDDRDALAHALSQSQGHEILITSGGASVGDHDLVQEALRDWGADLAFWKVAIKPGKPLMVATKQQDWGKQVILGLPGNPVSSFVTCLLFALPLIRAALGDLNPFPRTMPMVASQDLPATGSRREFLRGTHDGQMVRLAASQDSSALLALASANCLIDRPAGAAAVKVGDLVPVINLQNG